MSDCMQCALNEQIGEKFIRGGEGGEVDEFCSTAQRKLMICTCGFQSIMHTFRGYPHEGGLADAEGKKWWVYYHCPNCHYEWSFTKSR